MPLTFVLFGSTGDLAQKKIMPALARMHAQGSFPQGSEIIAYSRRAWSDEEYRAFIKPSLASLEPAAVDNFLSTLRYVQGTFDSAASYAALKEHIHTQKVFFHLAVQPEFFAQIATGLGQAGLQGTLLIEKPFGHDKNSAEVLEVQIEKYFAPQAILRVDHYLGKAGLQAVLDTRRTDTAFEATLTSSEVAAVFLRIVSPSDLVDRGEFFDTVGELRDVGQNHLLQMLATVLVDLKQAEVDLPAARAHALSQLVLDLSSIVRGQFEGYTKLAGVAPSSDTETQVKFSTHSIDPRWAGVPLVLEAGKGLAEKKSDIKILFKNGSERVFDMDGEKGDDYQTVLEAALRGEQNFFASLEEVCESWQLVDQVRAHFSSVPLTPYSLGGSMSL